MALGLIVIIANNTFNGWLPLCIRIRVRRGHMGLLQERD